jgi:hypothetical protein
MLVDKSVSTPAMESHFWLKLSFSEYVEPSPVFCCPLVNDSLASFTQASLAGFASVETGLVHFFFGVLIWIVLGQMYLVQGLFEHEKS